MDYIKEAFLLYLEETGAFGRPFNKYDNNFGRFSPAYTVSNEWLSEAMEILKPRGKSVLTVAASGDQAFFYKINGASHVDTFDISYCAHVMTNVKTAAVQTLDYTGYKEFLNSIKSASTDIMYVSKFPKISVALPQDTKRFLYTMSGQKYRSGIGTIFSPMTAAQYKKLRASVNAPFKFIWSDVMSLSGHLTQKYDQMYMSNIFQYNCDVEKNVRLIQSLLPFLNDGGEIMLCVTPFFRRFELDVIRNVAKALEKFVRIRLEATNHQQYAIVKKL
jgi:hypothetical protein